MTSLRASDPGRILAHLAHASSRLSVGRQVQVRHLGQGMTDGLVESALGHVSTGDVRDGHVVDQGGLGRRQDLETVAEHQHDVRTQVDQGPRHPLYAAAHGACDVDGRIAVEAQRNAGIDPEPVRLYLIDGHSEPGFQMHASGENLERDVRVVAQVVHDPLQQTIFGATARHDADCQGQAHASASFGLDGRLMTVASSRSATVRSARGQSAYIGRRCISVQIGRDI